MFEALIAIATLCQVTGTSMSYDEAKDAQISCQQKLIKCTEKDKLHVNKGILSDCVLEGVHK